MIGTQIKAMGLVVRGVGSAFKTPATSGLMILTATIILTAAVFYWLVEGWSFLDAMFFSVATISTVGYGDMVPETGAGRIFTMVYIFVGIGVFVVTAASIAEHVISIGKTEREKQEHRVDGRKNG